MAVLLAAHHGLTGNPVKLDHAAWARERLVTMPRIIAATERQQCPFSWRDLQNHVVEIVSGTEQPKPATSGLPPRIHIDQDRDDFCLRISMDFAVLFAATAAHGDHVGPIRQIDAELFFERLAKFTTAHFLDEPCKYTAVTDLAQRKAARPVDFGIIVVYRRARIGLHKLRNDQEFKRFAGKRGGAETFQIQR